MSERVPLSIDVAPHRLRVQWADGASELSATALRAACRCGGCRALALRTEPAAPATVQLTGAAPVGEYALQLLFSDGHDRGIYPWALLQELSAAASAAA